MYKLSQFEGFLALHLLNYPFRYFPELTIVHRGSWFDCTNLKYIINNGLHQITIHKAHENFLIRRGVKN